MEVKVFFATNRDLKVNAKGVVEGLISDKPWQNINLNAFRIGTAQVRIETENEKVLGEPLNDEAAYKSAQLAKEIYDTKKRVYTKRGSEEIFPQLLEAVHNIEDNKKGIRCSIMIFIHGFNNSFEESIITGAELAHLYSTDDHRLIPFVFSWPSDGEFSNIAYWDDRRDAELSGGAGARLLGCFLTYLAELRRQGDQCVSSAFLITHSMGAYLLSHAVQNLRSQVSRIFDATILMAPDVNADALENANKLLPIKNLTKEVVVYVNEIDLALKAAYHEHDESLRMGQNGPGKNAFDKLGVPLTTVRCRNVDFDYDEGSWHSYYRRSIAVIKDIKAVLSGKDPDEIDYREEVQPTGPDIYRYRLNPPDEYLNRPGTKEPPEEEID